MTQNILLKKPDDDKVTLFDWVREHYSDEEKREVFLNMDIALKYIHDHGYCIEQFYPSKIEILNKQPNHVQFDNIIELSSNISEKSEMIKEDIFNSTLIQIGLYTNTLNYLTPAFLKENFDEIARFLPEGDVPYYRGVVQRGASVYFSEFALEKMNRDLVQLEQQISESEGIKRKETDYGEKRRVDNLSNDKINDAIYKQISGYREAAFISGVLIPTLIVLSVILILLVVFIIINS